MATATLVHGLYTPDARGGWADARRDAIRVNLSALGVERHELYDLRKTRLQNRLLRIARGTARGFDAVEIFAYDEQRLADTLASVVGQMAWRNHASCASHGLDRMRSACLVGTPRTLRDARSNGFRLFWFGRGLPSLSPQQFAAHYTQRHGPLVAEHAETVGIDGYTQVVAEECDSVRMLRELGLGAAPPHAVFANVVMAPMSRPWSGMRARREATRLISEDERAHIDFGSSALLLCAR